MQHEDRPITVSIVLAAYNYERYVGEAIQSVKSQTFTNWELIVVDDGSTDNTANAIFPFLEDRRIHYHRHENQGQPATENTGVSLARAEWIAFLDADDRWFPEKLAKQLSLVELNPHASVVYAERLMMDPDGLPLPTPARTQYRGNILKEMFRQNEVPFSAALVRRSVIAEAGGFNPEYRHANDYDLWLRIAAAGHEFDFVPEPLIWYRTGHPNLTSRRDVQLKSAITIMDQFLRAHPDLLSKRWVRRCYSETYCHLGMVYFSKKMFFATSYWYMKSLLTQPTNYEAWHMFVRLFFPDSLIRLIRRFAIMLTRLSKSRSRARS